MSTWLSQWTRDVEHNEPVSVYGHQEGPTLVAGQRLFLEVPDLTPTAVSDHPIHVPGRGVVFRLQPDVNAWAYPGTVATEVACNLSMGDLDLGPEFRFYAPSPVMVGNGTRTQRFDHSGTWVLSIGVQAGSGKVGLVMATGL